MSGWRTIRRAFLAAIALLSAAAALSAAGGGGDSGNGNGNGNAKESRGQPRVLQEVYAGVVTDQTVTFIGQRFYREFVSHWSDRSGADRYSLAIFERPSARWGSLIWVEYANRKVFQSFVSPGKADLRAIGERAAETAYQNVVAADVQRLLIKEPDIGPDEI